MEELENKITKASKSNNARFKRKKIRSMKREADKIAEKLRESEKVLKSLESRIPKDLISGAPLNLLRATGEKESTIRKFLNPLRARKVEKKSSTCF